MIVRWWWLSDVFVGVVRGETELTSRRYYSSTHTHIHTHQHILITKHNTDFIYTVVQVSSLNWHWVWNPGVSGSSIIRSWIW